MTVRPIRLYPDPILRQVCVPVEKFDVAIAALIADLIETLDAVGHAVGIAAPQIGEARRVALIDCRDRGRLGRRILINPVIETAEGEMTGREGCLSLPDYTGNVRRARAIVLRTLDADGTTIRLEAEGFEAVCIQHEIDHLDGVLFLDRISSLKTDLFRRKQYR